MWGKKSGLAEADEINSKNVISKILSRKKQVCSIFEIAFLLFTSSTSAKPDFFPTSNRHTKDRSEAINT